MTGCRNKTREMNSRADGTDADHITHRHPHAPKNDSAIHDSATPFEVHTPASFTVETTMPPSFAPRAPARFETWEGSSSGMTHYSAAQRRFLLNLATLPRGA